MDLSDFEINTKDIEALLECDTKQEEEYWKRLDEELDHHINRMLFETAMEVAGIEPPLRIDADNKVHFFSLDEEGCDGLGWYVLLGHGFSMGAFGNLKTGAGGIWSNPDKASTK